MNPRKPLSSWQLFAQGTGLANSGFAPTQFSLHDDRVGDTRPCVSAPHCDPFPKTWPSPIGVGPLFSPLARQARDARTLADGVGAGPAGHGNFAFARGGKALESSPITTTHRGDTSCGKPSFFSFSLQPRLRAACKTPARVRLQALLPVRPLRMPPTKIWSQALRLAGLPVRQPAPSRARWAADLHDLTAPAAGQTTTPATQGGIPLGWLFHFSPARAALT